MKVTSLQRMNNNTSQVYCHYIQEIRRKEQIHSMISNIFYVLSWVALFTFMAYNYFAPISFNINHISQPKFSTRPVVSGAIDISWLSNDYSDYAVETLPVFSSSVNGGISIIPDDNIKLIKKDLPSKYYSDIDFSSFQPYMGYLKITDKTSPAYQICYSENAYTDSHGFRRYKVSDGEFAVDGEDDYMVALGTYYKEPGTVGTRFLIVTSTGMFTVITGSEKADVDTDPLNMYSTHCNGERAGLIEWIVDEDSLDSKVKAYGTVTKGPIEATRGNIIAIYEIK